MTLKRFALLVVLAAVALFCATTVSVSGASAAVRPATLPVGGGQPSCTWYTNNWIYKWGENNWGYGWIETANEGWAYAWVYGFFVCYPYANPGGWYYEGYWV